jgi:predicted molibdopterin-dependent oxidoreductase YjgC
MYFNSHGSNNSLFMNNVDTILPVSTSIEKNAKYINTEGRLQSTKKCFEPSKNVLTEHDIFETVFSNSIKLN